METHLQSKYMLMLLVRDPKFFKFYRSMQAYEKTFVDKDTTMILSPESSFSHILVIRKVNNLNPHLLSTNK